MFQYTTCSKTGDRVIVSMHSARSSGETQQSEANARYKPMALIKSNLYFAIQWSKSVLTVTVEFTKSQHHGFQ